MESQKLFHRKNLSVSNNKTKEILDNFSAIPILHSDIDILLPISGGEKKNHISSCGFGVLANRVKTLNISLSEEEIKTHFLQQTPTLFLRELTKQRRNIIGTGPSVIKKRFSRLLYDQGKGYSVIEKSGVTIDDIIKLLQQGQAIMVMYTRQQKLLFETMKEKSELFNTYLGKYEKTFTYPYPHYALLVGLNGKDQTVALLDPNTGKIDNIPFQLRREQFDLQKQHQGKLFHFAKKIGLMKPRTIIYLEEIS